MLDSDEVFPTDPEGEEDSQDESNHSSEVQPLAVTKAQMGPMEGNVDNEIPDTILLFEERDVVLPSTSQGNTEAQKPSTSNPQRPAKKTLKKTSSKVLHRSDLLLESTDSE